VRARCSLRLHAYARVPARLPEREEGSARFLCVKNKRMRSTRPETRTGSVRPQRLQIFPSAGGERTAGRDDGRTVIPGEGWTMDGPIDSTHRTTEILT